MAHPHWERVKDVFDGAVERESSQRSSYLAEVCGDDDDLRQEVERLIRAHEDSEDFIENLVSEVAASALRSESPRLSDGQEFGPYRIVAPLGAGGMGEVYLAQDPRLGRNVAIKLLRAEFTRDERQVRRFEQEARAASALNHPNILTIYQIGEAQGLHFIATEYVDGKTLRQQIALGRLDLRTALNMAIQIAEALGSAHKAGITHRDIKPENIILRRDGYIKVLDFGLAKLNEQTTSKTGAITRLTENGIVMGTAHYLSPEQARGLEVDARTDIFSLGVVLYEMIAGKPPFEGETPSHVIVSILEKDPAPLAKYASGVSSELERVVARMITKNREERYPTVEEVVLDLKRLKELGETGSIHKPADYFDRAFKVVRKRWATVASVLLAVGLVGVLLFDVPEPGFRVDQVDRALQLTIAPEMELEPALSPDGKMIAYAAGTIDRIDIYVRQVSGGEPISLTKDLLEVYHRWPRWSPDGQTIAFVSRSPAPKTTGLYYSPTSILRVVPSLGGIPRKVVMAGAVGHAWAPDGLQVAYIKTHEIYVGSVDGSSERRIAESFEPNSPSWSPDGKWLVFTFGNSLNSEPRILGNLAPSAIAIVPAGGGEPRRLTNDASTNLSPVWAADSRSILFVSTRGGSRDVYQLRLSASGESIGEPVRLTTGLNALSIDLSRDGHLAYSLFLSKQNLWTLPIPKSGPISGSTATALTTGSQMIEGVSVSRDRMWVAFDSNVSGNQDIYRMRRSDRRAERLTTDPADDFVPSYSPDGESIAFYSFRNGNRDIYVMSADGTNRQQVTNDPAQERYPEWSPNGQGLAYYSDKTGGEEVYVVYREHGAWGMPQQITTVGVARMPHWSPDGERIAYIGDGVSVISRRGGVAKALLPAGSPRVSGGPVWSPDGRTIFYRHLMGFWSVPVNGGKPTHLVKFDDPLRPATRPEFATDGKEFFFTVSERESDIWMLRLIPQQSKWMRAFGWDRR